jgi:predicted nuclease of predicted toxin-antitoxin system
VVVAKDSDFRHSHTVAGSPTRLLLVATGNVRNDDVLALFDSRLDEIATAFAEANFVELHREVLIIHGAR